MTGIPALTSVAIVSACSAPPSNLMAWQTVRFMMRAATEAWPVALTVHAEMAIDQYQGARRSPSHHFTMIDHVANGHRYRSGSPLDDHAQTVTQQQHIDSR